MSRARTMVTGMCLAVAATLTVGLVAGCGGDDSSSTPTQFSSTPDINPQPRENLRDGGTLTTSVTEVSPQWNTFQADGNAYTQLMWRWYNPMLAFFSTDGTYSFNRDYLTDVETTQVDGKTRVTYTINPKAVFNDGTPIDYRAFVTTWRASDGKDPAYLVGATDGYDQIESVDRGADDRQAVVTFRGVYAWPNGLFNSVLHPAVSSAEIFNTAYVQNPHSEWGAGPYIVDSYDKNAGTVTFTRNPKWWGKPGKLDRRVFRQLEDQASINAFRNGELDAEGVGTKDLLAQVKPMTNIDIRTASSPAQSLMMVNTDAPVLGDPRVRQAVLSGVDRTTLAKIRFTGLDYSEPLPGSLQMYAFQRGYEDNVTGVIDHDTAKAGKLLDEAGWTMGPNGIREKDGQPLRLTLPIIGDSPTTANLARGLQAMMKSLGVDIAIAQKPSSDFSKVTTNREFDLFFIGFQSSDPYGMAYLCQTWCKGSQLNRTGAGSAELDAKIKAVASIPDPKAQIAAGNKVEREAFGQFSDLPLFNGPTMLAVKKGLANYGAGQFYIGPVEDIGWQK